MSSDKNRGIPPPPSFSTAPDMSSSTGFKVPSFSSAPDLSELTADDDQRERKRKKHKRDRSSDRKRHRGRSRSPERSTRRRSRSTERRSRRRSRSPSSRKHHRSRERHSRRSRSPIPSSGQLETGLMFVVDTRGDSKNIAYGGNHEYSVPAYRRSGGGYIIGLPAIRISKDSATAGKVLKLIDLRKNSKKPLRYMDADYAWKEADKALKRIRIRPSSQPEARLADEDQDFIQIESDVKGKAEKNSQVVSSGVDYRSIEGPNRAVPDESDEESEEEGESFDEYVRRRTIEFNKQLAQEPQNVQAWLAFIAFQDEAAQGLNTGVDNKVRTKANKSSLNEVKMSIFEKALEANPHDETLILAYLECGEQMWDTLTLLQQWDKALKKHPESIRLWADYINLRQTNFSSFSFLQCVKVFEDCIATLNKVARRLQRKRKNEDNYEARESIESVMVYVLLRACLFMRQSGYHERGFGTMQAVVEFALFQPQIFTMSLDISFEDMVAEFAEFWDNEVPRFGEEGAKGWREYYRSKYNEEEETTPKEEPPEDENLDDVYSLQDWVRLEDSKERRSRLPRKMKDIPPEVIDEDPYVITLSDDVREFLFNLTTHEARQGLLYSIFVYLGLPFTPPGVGTNTHFCIDTFTHNDLKLDGFWPSTQQSLHITYVDDIPMVPEHAVQDKQPFSYPVSYPVGTSELFTRHGHWFSCVTNCHVDNDIEAEFTRNAFKQLLALRWTDHLAVCYLSFESSYSNKSARNLAKNLLKDNRTNLALWNVYAQMEKCHGKLKEARKVYQTALATYHTFPAEDQVAAPLLHSAFAQLEWEEGRSDHALNILVALGAGQVYDEKSEAPSNAQILKAQKFYQQKTSQLSLLTENEMDVAYHYIACYSLLQYLTRGIEEASAVYERALEYIEERHAERGFESEVLWVAYIKLRYKHVVMNTRSGYKPGQLREALQRAMMLFPNNTVFIGLYVWNEARTKLYNRVRTMFVKSLGSDPNIILWLSAIRTELHNHHPYDVNQVRTLFESAIESTTTRASILLWKLYIEHEVQHGDKARAKSLYYRAIRACPWSKDICLLGVRLLSRELSEKELHEIVSLMMEKEIRLRHPIDDRLLADENTMIDSL